MAAVSLVPPRSSARTTFRGRRRRASMALARRGVRRMQAVPTASVNQLANGPGAAIISLPDGSSFLASYRHLDGVVAQLVERLVRNEKVRGSTPLGSTIFFF